jgi:hypothetical protein
MYKPSLTEKDFVVLLYLIVEVVDVKTLERLVGSPRTL